MDSELMKKVMQDTFQLNKTAESSKAKKTTNNPTTLTDSFTYIIQGAPRALARAHLGKSTRMWDNHKSERFLFGMEIAHQHDGRPLFTDPISVHAIFYMPIPDYRGSKKKFGPREGRPHFYIPLLSYLFKMLEEGATGVLWNDPCIISHMSLDKRYDKNPRTEFTITKLG